MSFKFTSVGTQAEVVAALKEFVDGKRQNSDPIGRAIAEALYDMMGSVRIFVPDGMKQSFVLDMIGTYGGGNAPEVRLSLQPIYHQPAAPVVLTPADDLMDEIDKAASYDEGNPANHPQPTDENTDPRLLAKKEADPLSATGGVIGDDAHIMEF